MKAPTECEYGHWVSPLSPERVFATSETLGFARASAHGVFFLLSMPAEGNAQALMFRAADGTVDRVSPAGFNVRSRLNEYGGLPYAFTDDTVFYCNFRDQQIYRMAFDQRARVHGKPVPLTPAVDAQLRYADFVVDARRARLLCIREDHRLAGEPATTLVAIDMAQGGEGTVLFAGADFVASPVLSMTGDRLAFMTWSHPNMPWDVSEIRVSELDRDGHPVQLREVAQATPGALVQPLFHPDGDLYFLADWTDWWNLYRVPVSTLAADARSEDGLASEPVCQLDAEMCGPLWQLGQRNFAFPDAATLIFSYVRDCFWTLASLELASAGLRTLRSGLGTLEHVTCESGRAFYVAAEPVGGQSLETCSAVPSDNVMTLYACARSDGLEEDAVSRPEHMAFPGEEGQAYGVFYAPCNPACRAPNGSLPPLLVLVHGGPTGTARTNFNPTVQFWTSRGFAVLDVNHRGSTGYGRRFRHSLYGEWGVADVADVGAAVQHLIKDGRIDARRVAIRGGSAGGYVVLAALVQSALFRAGACYYGISDLELLVQDTHKFESRYLDQLIGPYPASREIYQARSPLHHIDQIQAAVLLLQGMEDKVVPPNQTQAIETRLRSLNPATRCLYFPDEGHGFRKPANQIAALEAELDFYRVNLLAP